MWIELLQKVGLACEKIQKIGKAAADRRSDRSMDGHFLEEIRLSPENEKIE